MSLHPPTMNHRGSMFVAGVEAAATPCACVSVFRWTPCICSSPLMAVAGVIHIGLTNHIYWVANTYQFAECSSIECYRSMK